MAMDIFLKLTDIEGESKDDKHTGEIDVITWSQKLTQTGAGHVGGGGGASKVNVHDLEFTKLVDKASCKLMLACCSGKPVTEGVLVVRKAGGDEPLEYLKITMNDIIVSSVNSGAARSDERHTESVSLNYAKFKVEYKEQKADGTGAPAGNMGWDIAANKKL